MKVRCISFNLKINFKINWNVCTLLRSKLKIFLGQHRATSISFAFACRHKSSASLKTWQAQALQLSMFHRYHSSAFATFYSTLCYSFPLVFPRDHSCPLIWFRHLRIPRSIYSHQRVSFNSAKLWNRTVSFNWSKNSEDSRDFFKISIKLLGFLLRPLIERLFKLSFIFESLFPILLLLLR